jgi:hypothetical protein
MAAGMLWFHLRSFGPEACLASENAVDLVQNDETISMKWDFLKRLIA